MTDSKKPESEDQTWDEKAWQPSEEELGPREWTGLLPQAEEEEEQVDWSEYEDGEVEKVSFEEETPKPKKAPKKNQQEPLFPDEVARVGAERIQESEPGLEPEEVKEQGASFQAPDSEPVSVSRELEEPSSPVASQKPNSKEPAPQSNSELSEDEEAAFAQAVSETEQANSHLAGDQQVSEEGLGLVEEEPADIGEQVGQELATIFDGLEVEPKVYDSLENELFSKKEAQKPGASSEQKPLLPLKPEPPKFDIRQKVEAILFATPKPIKMAEIAELLQDEAPKARALRKIVEDIQADYKNQNRGFELIEEQDAFEFRTRAEASELMERMFSNRPRPLSRAAQETLAIIAYRQPVTRADIEFIRGVDAGSIIKNLLERDFIKCVGRREISGRPMLFGTTDEFLSIYQLKTLDDLPPLASFQPNYDTRETLKSLNLDEEVDITEFVDDQDAPIQEEHPKEEHKSFDGKGDLPLL